MIYRESENNWKVRKKKIPKQIGRSSSSSRSVRSHRTTEQYEKASNI